ncbi:hypothetical protein V494_03597 [Pseudogymnoascus sp. VKM F-4513 (FW-928)]|nr:hypothetical protein V494_03597 [Pseudogymnoascus sp. VKM F-4513 (FW-928)]
MGFVYWECPLKPCPRPLLHTADLLERHLIMVHEPPDDEVAALVNKGKRPGRSLIEQISCPAPGCSEEWKILAGLTWDERMEHVAKHWEAVAKGEEPGGWTEEGGGLLEWAIKEGAVTELGNGRLMWEQALGVSWEQDHDARWPKESKGERKPTYDDASNLQASYITPSQLVGDDIGRRPFNFGGGQGGYTSQPMSRDGEKKATGRGKGKLPVRFVSEDEEESHPFSRPRHDDDDGIRRNSVLPSPRASLEPIHQNSDGNPTTRHFLDRKEAPPQKHRDGDNKSTGSDTGATTITTPPRTEVPRESNRLLKRISGLTKALRPRSVRDVDGPAPQKATPGGEKRKSKNPILALPRLSSVSRSSASKGDDGDDDGEFPDLPPAGLRMSSPLNDTLNSDEPIPPMGQPMDAEVEEQLSRLKRRFSSKNWTEKGRGEQKAKEKGKGVVDATKQATPSINAPRDIGDIDQSTPPQVSHQTSNPRPMPVCWDHGCDGRKFSTYDNLLRHQQEMAGAEPKPTCPECGEEFSTEMKRNEHMVECMKGDGKALARFIEEGTEKAERKNVRKEREVLRSVRSAGKDGGNERVNDHDGVTADAERWNSLQLSSDKAHAIETLSRPKPVCWDHGCNGREFKTYDHLLQHQKQMAGEAASPTCPRCFAAFASAEAQNRHMEQGMCEQEDSAEPADREGRGGRVDDDERPIALIRSAHPFTHDSWRPLHPPLTVCWDHGCDGREFSNFANLVKHRREMADVEQNPICGKCGSDLSNPMERKRHTGQYCKARGSMDSTTEYIQKKKGEMRAMKLLEAAKRQEVMKREDAIKGEAIKREKAIERGKAGEKRGEIGEGADREGGVEGKKGRDGRVDDDQGLVHPIRSTGSSEDDTWYPLYPKPTVWGPRLQEGNERGRKQ